MSAEDHEVAAVLDAVRTRVRARRAASAGATEDPDEQASSEIAAAIQDVNVHSRVNSHLPLLWEDMIVGRLRAFVQRVVRRLLRWYINPIVDQQNIYNAASAKALTLLAAENARLRREHAELVAKVEQLERANHE